MFNFKFLINFLIFIQKKKKKKKKKKKINRNSIGIY